MQSHWKNLDNIKKLNIFANTCLIIIFLNCIVLSVFLGLKFPTVFDISTGLINQIEISDLGLIILSLITLGFGFFVYYSYKNEIKQLEGEDLETESRIK